jgi:hypothetical protein
MKIRIVVFFSIAAVLAACSGGSNQIQSLPATGPASSTQTRIVRLKKEPKPTPFPASIYTPLPADIHVQRAVMPTPFDPRLPVSMLGTAQIANANASAKLPHRRTTQSFALAPPDDHEAEGTFMFGDAPPYNALFGTQTAYEASQNPFPPASGKDGGDQIFVPTMHPAWGSCLENSTYYNNAAGATAVAQFTVFNFCLPSASFIFAANIDSTFLRNYVRLTDGGFPSYVSEIFTSDTATSGSSTWYSVLYNFQRHRYDLIASVNANGFFQGDAFGWSIVEPYPAQGTCPQIAPALVTQLSTHNTITGAWDAVTPFMAGGAYSFIGLEGGSTNVCLDGDSTGSASIDFTLLNENYEWEATSPRT